MRKDLIGGKAYNLLKLKSKVNIPDFYIIDNTNYTNIINNNFEYLIDDIINFLNIHNIKHFSVRSSPVYSMPGTMDTVLNCNIDNISDIIYQIANSYNNDTAILYRKLKKLPNVYPGIIIQKMIYGNKNDNSGTGVLFTRDNIGNKVIFGEYIQNSLGDDLVSNDKSSILNHKIFETYKSDFINISNIAEQIFKEPQEIEFTIEDGIIHILQSRDLQFHNLVYFKILSDLYKTQIIDTNCYELKVRDFLRNKTYKYINSADITKYIDCKVACPGIVYKSNNNILIKHKILNEDLELLNKYDGVITFEGSITSHPAILCRNLGLPYVIISESDYIKYLEHTDQFIIDGYNNKIILDTNITIHIINSETTVSDINKFIDTL